MNNCFAYTALKNPQLLRLGTADSSSNFNVEESASASLEAGPSDATEFNVLNCTDNYGHTVMFSSWNVKRTGMKRLTMAVLVHSEVEPNYYKLRVVNDGVNRVVNIRLASSHDRYADITLCLEGSLSCHQ